MKSAEEFLRKFREGQIVASVQHGPLPSDLSEIDLDSTLTSALQRGWCIAPALARSKYFSRIAVAGNPTQDLAQIRYWAREYAACGCSWVVETGKRSALLVLEFTYDIGRETLQRLCEDDWSWRTTLQFTNSNARFVCFTYSGQQTRKLGSDFPGVRIHRGECLLIPPSVTGKGDQISYLNSCAQVLDFPDWLLAVSRVATNPHDRHLIDAGDRQAA
jgi:Bifunctional DNA primase/polymerase, N-terminal